MITSLRLVNFKNFADETLRVGPFTLLVGANASGKSNIRDAFRFLHGIGRGYTLAEIMGGKYGPGGPEWAGIRGAPNEVARHEGLYPYVRSAIALQIELDVEGRRLSYLIKVGFDPTNPFGFFLQEEELRTESAIVYTTIETNEPELWLRVGKNGERQVSVSRSQPALTQFLQNQKDVWYQHITEFGVYPVLENIRFFELSPERMREPSIPGVTTLGDFGQYLPTVLEGICVDRERKNVLTGWLRELTPMDVSDFEFPRDAIGRVYLRFVEANGRRISADSASDGTLRFLSMLAALLGPNTGGLLFLEEIDNGIHPARLSLLIELLERQTSMGKVQVVSTTHSPGLLGLVNDRTFENTSVVYRDENSGDAVIRPVAELPKARELRKSQGLGRLHAAGWMENMLAFAEADNDDGEDSQ